MTFRDDHDAALARAAALEEELQRTKAELDKTKGENAELKKKVPKEKPKKKEKPPPEPRPHSDGDDQKTTSTRVKIIWGVVAAVGAFFMVVYPGIHECQAEKRYKAALAAHKKFADQWEALLRFEDCARDTLVVISNQTELDAANTDPRDPESRQNYLALSRLELEKPCVFALVSLLDRPTLAPAHPALHAWRVAAYALAGPRKALADYLGNRDWKDDDYRAGPGLWAAYKPAMLAFLQKTTEALAAATPAVRAEIRSIQAEYEKKHGRNDVWWRIELGMLHNELASAPFFNEQVPPKVKALRDGIAQAPLEVRRELRSTVDELEWVEKGKSPWEVSGYNLWEKIDDAGDGPVPKRPERPEGCGDGGG